MGAKIIKQTIVQLQALAFGGPGEAAQPVTPNTPLPVSMGQLLPSDVEPVSVALSAVGASPAFAPILGRPFNVTHKPSTGPAFAGAYQLEKKFAGDDNWYVALGYADLPSLPESFALTETEAGVTYRWNCTARTAGSVAVRISA